MNTPMTAKVPKVLLLGAFTPAPEFARADRLQYNQLLPEADRHRPHETARMRKFLDAEPDSLEEQAAAEQLAAHYLLLGSAALNTSRLHEMWSDRFTQSASEIYGEPDAELARQLWIDRQAGIETEPPFAAAARVLREHLSATYSPVYDALRLDLNSAEQIQPDSIADRFEAALGILSEYYDEDWREWTICRDTEKDSLSVIANAKQIVVGQRRANVSHSQLRSLFTHEVLVHAQRSVNGRKRSSKLATGLPGYLDAEEGLGVFAEYAVSGEVPQKNIDRYLDIAYALGQIDGQQHTRHELLDLVRSRALERNAQLPTPKSIDVIEQEVYAHVNRIYRGSLGDSAIGVFPKDINYHRGFVEMGGYIQTRLDEGNSIEEILHYLMLGKFDPTNPLHTEYVRNLSVPY